MGFFRGLGEAAKFRGEGFLDEVKKARRKRDSLL